MARPRSTRFGGEHGEQGRAEAIIAESPQVGDPPASPSRREGCRVSGSRESAGL